MSRDVLVIKLGALGDVLRTTPLLRRLPGRITWVTDAESLPILKDAPRLHRAVPFSSAGSLRGKAFDLVLNFDEDVRACRLAASMKASRRAGAWLDGGAVSYCENSAPWFDMSLVSRLGREKADRLKKRGRRAYQDYLFRACGLRFRGEEYVLPVRPAAAKNDAVALESRVGEKWPMKAWSGFGELEESLEGRGLRPFVLKPRARLADYFADINRASVVVAGDTLAMHAALALRKKVVALFTCTSPDEIHGYGRLAKLVDARLAANFYRRDRPRGERSSISPADVLDAVLARRRR